MADSLCCTAETDITLGSNYTPRKIFLKRKKNERLRVLGRIPAQADKTQNSIDLLKAWVRGASENSTAGDLNISFNCTLVKSLGGALG